ncbi:hypothetical protein EJ02DRAFT_132265 [Clathrospora elynae]|uniref:Uncharacterized protein n=1 Tax=Clathrospora elynae TaxID=706981 RepID=A0A6A5SAA0_9PLEO|nr:hypothetical protein EJ02DRAFT_132265 [Clathrospora elynae]
MKENIAVPSSTIDATGTTDGVANPSGPSQNPHTEKRVRSDDAPESSKRAAKSTRPSTFQDEVAKSRDSGLLPLEDKHKERIGSPRYIILCFSSGPPSATRQRKRKRVARILNTHFDKASWWMEFRRMTRRLRASRATSPWIYRIGATRPRKPRARLISTTCFLVLLSMDCFLFSLTTHP